jgi:hypothetical protein
MVGGSKSGVDEKESFHQNRTVHQNQPVSTQSTPAN